MSFEDVLSQYSTPYSTGERMNRGWKEREYEQALTSQGFSREDTEIQRRVADMKAAGINPTLAAGGGASSSMPMSGGIGSRGKSSEIAARKADMVSGLIQMQANVSKTKAEKRLTDKMTKGQELANVHFRDTMEPKKDVAEVKAAVAKETQDAQIIKVQSENQIEWHKKQIAWYDTELARLGLSESKMDYNRMVWKYEKEVKGEWTGIELEHNYKKIMYDIMLDQAKYYGDKGLPANWTTSFIMRYAQEILSFVAQALKLIEGR